MTEDGINAYGEQHAPSEAATMHNRPAFGSLSVCLRWAVEKERR
jgi:hypothetical protein